ncbi:hypothetical protein GHT07_05930 [Caenimonas koreensis DSM 17982]|uniref:Carboxypeptidase regulatory-like domain-containing protein n=1 Tax=Caenimonas koreensis DSM 17982 TaxID=1121255 RepID=A0A844ARE7_9BURK|nr:hypothetical protein [Caenimonas koreensis]MRD46805.1 hypothetical protein [Caenimonas koreensis DSM 17982]
MRSVVRRPFLLLSAAIAASALIVACGGGGGGGTVTPTTISGSVVKGPVSAANVCAYKAVAGGKGDQLACTTTNASGAYSFDIQYTGDVVIEASGGTYVDEATHVSTALSTPLQVVIASSGGTATGIVTPLTSVAYSMAKGMSGGVSSANFSTAATNVATQFQLGSINIATTAPTIGSSANVYGKALQAFSQFVAAGGSFSAFVTWTNPASFQSAYSSAYVVINGNSITFTFTGTGINPGGGSTESCGITVAGSGTVSANGGSFPFTLPPTKVCVTGLPTGACSAGNSQLQSLASSGATPAGNYSISYTYAYAPNDCAGALVTVNYQ